MFYAPLLQRRLGQWLVVVALLGTGIAFAQAEPTLSQIYSAAHSGQLDQAQVMIQQVLIAHPNSSKAHFVQAELFTRQGKANRATEALATAEKLAPGLPFAKPEAAQNLRAQIAAASHFDNALYELFGSVGTNGVLKTGPDELTSLFVKLPFRFRDKEHVAFLIKTQKVDRETGNPLDCHVCSVKLSAVVFQKIGADWIFLSKSKFFTEFGSWGDATLTEPVQILNDFATDAVGFLFDGGWSGQGYTDWGKVVMVYRGNRWHDLGFVQTGSDNSGACNESEKAKLAGDFKACWKYESSITLEKTTDASFPNIIVHRSGTMPNENYDVIQARDVIYRHAINGYESDEKKKK